MSQPYSQARALWAITRASFKAIFNHPTAVVFSLLFPIIFILIFGAFGSGGAPSYRITIDPASNIDTTSAFFQAIRYSKQFRVLKYDDTSDRNKDFTKGRLAASLLINETKDSSGRPHYTVKMTSTTASGNTIPGVMDALDYITLKYELAQKEEQYDSTHYVKISRPEIRTVRKYRQIDFILPGQLGFSILFSTLFGIAFTFFALREQLVLKRFYASPVSKINILAGIGMSRLFFQLMNVIVLILFGHFFLNFTLQHGFITVIEMILMTIIMLFLLMGVGLIFSSVVKSDTSIPLLINLFGFPQMLLSGTFFPIEVFPKWLQDICQFLPLTQFNNAMRKISFEGQHLYDCWKEMGILAAWIIVAYIILVRVIKWE